MMLYENNFYITHDISQDIEFLFVDLGSDIGWRAYILSHIDYKGRDTSCTTIHRLTDSDEHRRRLVHNFMNNTRITGTTSPLHYICWSKAVHSLDDIREVAKTWSEITAYYIKHGGSFPTIQRTLKKRGVISF